MQKKVLFCATVDQHLLGFHLPYLKWFKEQNWELHVAAYGDMDLPFVDKKYNIPFQRSPLSLKNWKAYKELKSLIDKNGYQIIHCHTPVGGVLTRLAARKSRILNSTKVIYTAHGFHFYKGAPFINWIVYYPVEKGLSNFTDCLITINSEDFNFAIRKICKSGEVRHVHGVGVDTEKFKPIEVQLRNKLRSEFGYKEDDFLMFYAAEFNKNKNQEFLLNSLALIKDKVPNAKLLLAGDGPLLQYCQNAALRLGIDEMTVFLGYREDLPSIVPMCDIAVASSLREGLPVNIMEAMSSGLPVIASKNRGHSELIEDHQNGYIISANNQYDFGNRILELYYSKDLCIQMGNAGLNKVAKYSISQVCSELIDIYSSYMVEDINETQGKYNRAYL